MTREFELTESRIDKTAFEFRQAEFLRLLYDQLLTPTSFTEDFAPAPEDDPSQLFAELAVNLVPEGLEDDLNASSRIFYEELIRDTESADYLNYLISGEPDTVDETSVYNRSTVNRSLSVLAHLSSESVQRQYDTAIEEGVAQGQDIADWYTSNFAGLSAQLGLDPAFLQDAANVDIFDTFRTHATNQAILEQELLRIFTEVPGTSESARPSEVFNWQIERNVLRLEQVILAFQGDTIQPGQVDIAAGLELLNAWSETLQNIEASVDPLTYAVANGIFVNAPTSGNLDETTLLAAIDPQATILDQETGEILSAEDYVRGYLADIPSQGDLSSVADPLNTWFGENLGIDLTAFLQAHEANVGEFYRGASFSDNFGTAILAYDTLSIFAELAAGAEAAGGTARGVAFADFQLFVIGKLIGSDEGTPPTFPDAWFRATEISGLSDTLQSILSAAYGDVPENASNAQLWSGLVADRQKIVSSYIMASDDARDFYALQIAAIDQNIDAYERVLVDGLESLRDNSPEVQTQIDDALALFDTAQERSDNLALLTNFYDGTRTDQPILTTPLRVTESSLIDLRWTGDPTGPTPAADFDTIYNNGVSDSEWRTITSPELYEQLLPALTKELGKDVDLSGVATIAELEGILRAQVGGEAFLATVDALASDISGYNNLIVQYEIARLGYLRRDPLERQATWNEADALLGASDKVLAKYQSIDAALGILGVAPDFLRSAFDIPELGSTSGGGEPDRFGYVPSADVLLAEVEADALRYDLAAMPGLAAMQFPELDAVMPADWRTDSRADIKNKIEAGLTLINLPDGGRPTFSAKWLDDVSTAILNYANAVTAYEKTVVYALLNGASAENALQRAATLRQEINNSYDGVIGVIQSEDGGFGDTPPDPIDLLDDTYGLIRNADGIENTPVNGSTLLQEISLEIKPAFLDGTEADPVIRYFDPASGEVKDVAADFSPVAPASPGTPPPVQTVEFDIFNDIDRQVAIADLGQGFSRAADLNRIASEPKVNFDFNDLAGRTSSALSGGDLGFSLLGFGQTIVQLSEGADPLAVASATGNTLSGLSLAVAEFLDTVYSDSSSTILGKYTALKAFSVVAGAAGAVTSIANYQDQRTALREAGVSTAGLDVQIGLEAGAAGLMALDGVLSTLVLAGKITGLAAKAVPLLGSVAQLMLSFNPANKVFYDVQENAIADARARDDYSSALAASLLEDSLDTQRAGDTSLLAVNLVSGSLGLLGSLAGFGVALGATALTPLGPILGAGAFVAGAVSFVLSLVNDAKMRKLAEEAREKILETDGVTDFQDFFNLSFEDQQAKLLEAYEEVVVALTEEQGFGSVVGLSTQRFTADDITVAQEANIADQITKSAATYLSEYRDGTWTDITGTIVTQPGLDEIQIAANDEPVYFTDLNDVLASGDPVQIRLYEFGAIGPGQFGPKFLYTAFDYSAFDGWNVVDADGNRTTFDLANIFTLANVTDAARIAQFHQDYLDALDGLAPSLGANEYYWSKSADLPRMDVTLPFVVSAGDNDDVVFSYDSSIIIDGGEGKDTVSYIRLDDEALAQAGVRSRYDEFYTGLGDGVVVRSHADRLQSAQYLIYETATSNITFDEMTRTLDDPNAIIVERPLDFFNGILIQRSVTDKDGETPEFFAAGRAPGFSSAFDQVVNAEVLQGSVRDDFIDLRGYADAGSNAIAEVYGFDGNDILIADKTTVTIGGGIGDDTINIALPWAELNDPVNGAFAAFSAAEQSLQTVRADETKTEAEIQAAQDLYDLALADLEAQAIYVGGGAGRDAVFFGETGTMQLIEAHEAYRASKLEADLLFAAISDAVGTGFGESSVADLFQSGLGDVTGTAADNVDLQDVEGVTFTLAKPDFARVAGPDDNLPYLTPALNGLSTGDANYDRVFYAADYQRIVDDLFTESRTLTIDGLPIERMTIEGLDIWDGLSPDQKLFLVSEGFKNPDGLVETFGATVTLDGDSLDKAEITNTGNTASFDLVTGQIYLVKGITYAFSTALETLVPEEERTTDFFALLDPDGTLDNPNLLSPSGVTTGFVAEKTGYYSYYWASELEAGETAALHVTGSAIQNEVVARIGNGEGFEPVSRTGLTGAFTEDLPFATRNTIVVEQNIDDEIAAPRRHFDEIGGDLDPGTVRLYEGEIWMQAGETYNYTVVADDVLFDFKINDETLIGNTFPIDGRPETFEGSITATQTGFRSFSIFTSTLSTEDGSFELYTRAPGAGAEGQLWSVLGHTEGRAADLDASNLTEADLLDLGGGVTLIGEKRGENLTGSVGNDLLYGGDALDLLDGGLGNDLLIGGRGADVYRLGTDTGFDLLTEEQNDHWDFATIRYDGYVDPDPVKGEEGTDLLVGFRLDSGDLVIGSINLTAPGTPLGITRTGTDRIEAAMVLPVGTLDAAREIFIEDRFGVSVTFGELEARTQGILGGGDWGFGYTFSFPIQSQHAAYVSTAIDAFKADWAIASTDPMFQTAREDFDDPDTLRSDALETFLRDEGVVLSSQAVFNLEEAVKNGRLDPTVEAAVDVDSEGDVELEAANDMPVLVATINGTPMALPLAGGFTLAGFAEVDFQNEVSTRLLAFTLSDGAEFQLVASASGVLTLTRSGAGEFGLVATGDDGPVLPDGEAAHFALRISDGVVSLFVEGQERALVSLDGFDPIVSPFAAADPTITSITFGNGASIGPDKPAVTHSRSYIFDEGLSDAQIANLAREGAAIVNDAPVAQDDAFGTSEDAQLTGDLLADNGFGVDSDPDGNPLEIISVNDDPDALGNQILLSSGALLTVNADGTFEYDTNGAFEALAQDGAPAFDGFSYVVSDGIDKTATANVQIRIDGENDAPEIINPLGLGVTEGQVATYDVSYFLDRVTDIDTGAQVSLDFVDQRFATFDGDSTVTVDGTNPAFDFLPKDVVLTEGFEFGVRDEFGAMASVIVPLNVRGTNDAPVAEDDSLIADEDTGFQATIAALLSNDLDPDLGENPAIAGFDDSQTIGTLTFTGGEGYAYDPNGQFEHLNAGEVATDRFFYTVTDSNGATDVAEVTITVHGINDAPVAGDDLVSTDEDVPVSGSVAGNDTDIDDAELTYSVESGPTHGSLIFDATGSFTYIPDADYNGSDLFSYTVSDGELSDTATVSLSISAVNDAPVAADDMFAVYEDDVTLDLVSLLLSNDNDVDGDALRITGIDTTGTLGTVNFDIESQNLTFAADADVLDLLEAGETEQTSFTYTISDPAGATSTATVDITVEGIAEPNRGGLLTGGRGNDALIGDENDNRIRGGAGNDLLNGGAGNDDLIGGQGSDTFVFNPNAAQDTITGFEIGNDVVDARGVLGVATHAEVFDILDTNGDGLVTGSDENATASRGRLTLNLTDTDSITFRGISALSEAEFGNFFMG